MKANLFAFTEGDLNRMTKCHSVEFSRRKLNPSLPIPVNFQLSIFNFQLKNMSQDNLIKLQCKECKRVNYWSSKNKKKVEKKIELKKHCQWCRKHTLHKETKK